MTVTALPRHAAAPESRETPRWVPSRAGILNVWRYYDEVLEFHAGRLLLHGENGSGKSKALELLLPFLFDANLRASRLSTFGTGERTMHWNLMGEGASGTTRVGYVWLEFRRDTPDGVAWFCCGARLQASTHTTTVHPDFFTTSRRIGQPDGLSLVTEADQPLTRNALEQQLGDDGALHANASDYRSAVRQALFPGSTEQRYDALITALLQLRMPKLSQRLDPKLLSTLLSWALPPMGQTELADLAEGFERLDRQQERLTELDEEVAAAEGLAGRQRTYARRVLRASAAALVSATTKLDDLTKAARRSAEQYEQVSTDRDRTTLRLRGAREEQERTGARITGITDSESYQRGQELDRLRERTAEAAEQAAHRGAEADRHRAQADHDAAEHAAAEQIATGKRDLVRMRAAETRHAATRAGLAGVQEEIAGTLEDPAARPRLLLRAAVRGRQDQLTEVRRALGRRDHAVDRRVDAERDLDQARERLAEATDRREAAARRYEQELDRLTGQLRGWAARCRELTFADPERLGAVAESEAELHTLVAEAAQSVRDELTRARSALAAERAAVHADRDELTIELDRLATVRDLPPPVPRTRTAARENRPGGPLWQLVRFADHTPESVQAPIEAALESSGLLDAWVDPSGTVMVDGHDLFADPAALPPAPGRSLADVLTPEHDPEVPAPVVERLLAVVGYHERLPMDGPSAVHPAAVGADGRWRLGPLTGSWAKERPAYIGALARRRAREQRTSELRADIERAELTLAQLDTRLDALAARRSVLDGELASRPTHDDLDAAAAGRTRAESDVGAADRVVRDRLAALSEREQAVSSALRVLTALAAEHGLPTERVALDGLAGLVDRFAEQGEQWLDEHGELLRAQEAARRALAQAERAELLAGQQRTEAEDAAGRHRSLQAMLEAVESSIGVDYRQLLAELDALRRRLRKLVVEQDSGAAELQELAEQLGALNQKRRTDAASRDQATELRNAAAHRFRHLGGAGFAADSAMPNLAAFQAVLAGSDGVRAALDAARSVAASWATVPHEPKDLGNALHALSESLHACQATLIGRADLTLQTDEDVQLFTATVDGARVGAAELLHILRVEAEQSRQDITARERELFDRTLTGTTRRHLADRIRQADALVQAMNGHLERVRTASKVSVRLVWQVAKDLPPGTRAARDLLLKSLLTEAETASLHRFLRERIEQAKADGTAQSWEQQLAQVFDYTAWHQFIVKIDRANGDGEQELTRKLHGALSGGEKAIALHLPLFAAVAAHYQAVPQAPRLILLDEVFVGVDRTNRGQIFELLCALDLDLMLTSDHEWCTYRELPGIAIHQLMTGDGSRSDGDPVTTARFVWNGHDLLPGESAD